MAVKIERPRAGKEIEPASIKLENLVNFNGDCIDPLALVIVIEALDYALENSSRRAASLAKVFPQARDSIIGDKEDPKILNVIAGIRSAMVTFPLCKEPVSPKKPAPTPSPPSPPPSPPPPPSPVVTPVKRVITRSPTPPITKPTPLPTLAVIGAEVKPTIKPLEEEEASENPHMFELWDIRKPDRKPLLLGVFAKEKEAKAYALKWYTELLPPAWRVPEWSWKEIREWVEIRKVAAPPVPVKKRTVPETWGKVTYTPKFGKPKEYESLGQLARELGIKVTGARTAVEAFERAGFKVSGDGEPKKGGKLTVTKVGPTPAKYREERPEEAIPEVRPEKPKKKGPAGEPHTWAVRRIGGKIIGYQDLEGKPVPKEFWPK